MNRKLAVACGVALLLGLWTSPATADPGRGTTVLCYLWANNATSAINVPYSPSAIYSYNAVARADQNFVTRTGVGQYTVTCKGVGGANPAAATAVADEQELSRSTNAVAREAEGAIVNPAAGSWGPGGHVQVTAYGAEDADQCKVQSWVTGGKDFSVTVRCYNHAGALSDNRFDLLFLW
jgi:hypothetical protein